MRPESLYSLFAPLTALSGVGPRISELLQRLCGAHVVDLLWHIPIGIVDRRFAPKVVDAPEGAIATFTVTIDKHLPSSNRRLPHKVLCSDDTGTLQLVFFHGRADYLETAYPIGETRVISGKVELYDGAPQMVHPDHVAKLEDLSSVQTVEPIYGLTAGVTPKVLSRAIGDAVSRAPLLPEWLDQAFIRERRWASWHESVEQAHAPQSQDDLLPVSRYRERLAYDELLANQLALLIVRARQRRLAGRSIEGNRGLRNDLVGNLPYALTGAQRRTLEEIESDMASEDRMIRLLQGDVGSGKTVVGLLAALNAVECGLQCAIMAPTDVLARQHFATIEPLASGIGVKSALLTGRETGVVRRVVLEGLASGEVAIAIGTHALFQDDVRFHDLGLAIIDEQHRFGVHQRLALTGKGADVDLLVMTATPIPRTLMMTAYGDMDISRLDEKPPGRAPIDTRVVSVTRLEEVYASLSRAIADGARAFWVCPLVEESEILDVAAATERYEALRDLFGESVGLVHGQMKGPDKDDVVARFAAGDLDILVATTVIEVGIDVPEASVMIVEHAERFGLAQLHQLRGRVGRGSRNAACLLIYSPPLGETARSRLNVMRETEDGFRIAEEDLRLRGAGEILGTKQSGLPRFRIADISAHGGLLGVARDDAKLILEKDPELESERGRALRTLLYLFERDSVVATLRSG